MVEDGLTIVGKGQSVPVPAPVPAVEPEVEPVPE